MHTLSYFMIRMARAIVVSVVALRKAYAYTLIYRIAQYSNSTYQNNYDDKIGKVSVA